MSAIGRKRTFGQGLQRVESDLACFGCRAATLQVIKVPPDSFDVCRRRTVIGAAAAYGENTSLKVVIAPRYFDGRIIERLRVWLRHVSPRPHASLSGFLKIKLDYRIVESAGPRIGTV